MKLAKIVSAAFCAGSAVLFAICILTNQSGTDKNGPKIEMDKDVIEVSIQDEKSVYLEGITATDEKDGDVTDSLVVESISNFIEKGHRKVSIVAFDSDNNVSRVTREIVYTDYESPRFSLTGPLRFAFSDGEYTKGLSVNDCLDGNITGKIRVSYVDGFQYGTPGEYQLNYTVSNSAGDALQFPVTVEFYNITSDNGPKIELTDYLIYIGVGGYVQPEDYLSYVTGGLRLGDVAIENNVDASTPGMYEIVYRVTDEDGLSGVARLIVIVEE